MMRLLVIVMVMAAIAAVASPLRPCQYEDGTWCTWYAQYQGNGTGTTTIRLID